MITLVGAEVAVDARTVTDYQKTLIVFTLLSNRMIALQDALITSTNTTSDHISRERGKYLGLQEAAKILLETCPISFSEQELLTLADLVKLTPAGTIGNDGKLQRYNHAANVQERGRRLPG